jgi:hypothetical protein
MGAEDSGCGRAPAGRPDSDRGAVRPDRVRERVEGVMADYERDRLDRAGGATR